MTMAQDFRHSRTWKLGDQADDGSVETLGNGRLLAYLRGPDLIHLWGPTLSSPNLAALRLAGPPGVETISRREAGAAIWQHEVRLHGRTVGRITDGVDPELACLVRLIESQVSLRFDLATGAVRPGRTGPASRLVTFPPGARVYGEHFAAPSPFSLHVSCLGAAVPGEPVGGAGLLTLTCGPGRSGVLLVAGNDWPGAVVAAEQAEALGPEAMLARTRRHWAAWNARRQLPPLAGPLAQAVGEAAEDVDLAIATQRSREGGVVAGHNYCLAYVRDQYGVSRGMLALGRTDEARGILEFYRRIHERYGRIHNAQSIYEPTTFHVHENDAVEMTGYLIVQAFDYLDRTDDTAFVRTLAPMLEWAFASQEACLTRGMLPFNGDETYVAGGLVPRSVLRHGSAEATALFIAGGRRLAAWLRTQGLWGAVRASEATARLAEAEAAYRESFLVDGRLLVNHPALAELQPPPRFRHGVCLGTPPGPHPGGFGWTEHYPPDGRYLCPECLAHATPQPVTPQRYYLASVALTPVLVGWPWCSADEARAQVETALRGFGDAQARFAPCAEGRAFPGYELGVLLYGMVAVGHPAVEEVARALLALRDPTGVWVEYYAGGQPRGTRARPWESALDLVGLVAATAPPGKG